MGRHLLHQRSVAPVRGLLSPTRDRRPRAYATWQEECRPSRGFRASRASSTYCDPLLRQTSRPGLSLPQPFGALANESAGEPLSLSEKVSSPPADLSCVPGGGPFPAEQSVAVFPALAPGAMPTRLSVRPSGKSRQHFGLGATLSGCRSAVLFPVGHARRQ